MATEIKKEIELEIAHVLFIDIVRYSKLLIDEQRDYLHTLNEVVRETDSFRAAEAAGKLTRLPTGDGMALVFATRPDAPVSCALQVSKALRSHPELRVRMGIHSGPVSGVTDVNDRSNVAGAGINLAQRVMDCGDAAHILLSKRVADDLEQYRQWRSHLHDLGECEVKHDVRVHVVNLYTDELGNPETPEKFQQPKETQTALGIPVSQAKPPRRSWTSIAAFIIASGLIAAAGAAAMWFLAVHRHEEKANETKQALAVEQPKPAKAESHVSPMVSAPARTWQAQIEQFVRQFVLANQSKDDPYAALALYAPTVDYFDDGQKDQVYISRDLRKYNKQWPTRHDEIEGDINLQEKTSGREYAASFKLNFYAESLLHTEWAKGQFVIDLTISVVDGELKISGIKEKMVRMDDDTGKTTAALTSGALMSPSPTIAAQPSLQPVAEPTPHDIGAQKLTTVQSPSAVLSPGSGDGTYQTTKDGGTLVWNNHPRPGDEASWSGDRDADGYATGLGTLTWYKRGTAISRYSGKMIRGKLDGPVTNTDANGKRFHGTFVNGSKSADWTRDQR